MAAASPVRMSGVARVRVSVSANTEPAAPLAMSAKARYGSACGRERHGGKEQRRSNGADRRGG